MRIFNNRAPLKMLVLLIFFSVTLLIIFLPKTKKIEKPVVSVSPVDTTLSIHIQDYIHKNKELEKLIEQYHAQRLSLDTLIHLLRAKKQFVLSTYFEEIKYQQSVSDTLWYYLGKNYYEALGFLSDASEFEPLLSSAVRCFKKALTLNDKNTNAHIMLASCYVQSKSPMLGVQMLKELEKKDSTNVLLQMQLAEFSLRSNQLDKAIQRYQKVLRLDPTKTEVYAYLSNLYLQKQDTLQSIQFLRKFAATISDTALKSSIQRYIHSLEHQ